jgi:hypothetical protein
MRGSLDDPPIIIVTSRGKFLLVLAICLAFGITGVFMGRDGQTRGDWIAVFFGLGVIVALWRIWVPARLELSPEHLLWFTGNKAICFRWIEFQDFVPFHPSRFSTHVGYFLAPGSQLKTSVSDWSRGTFGVSGSFGGSWEIGTPDLIELLNTARKRWSVS